MREQAPAAIAVTVNLPAGIGWAVQGAERSWSGKDLKGLLDCLADSGVDDAVLSVTLLLRLELGQGGNHENTD